MKRILYLFLICNMLIMSCVHDSLYVPVEEEDVVIVDDECDPDLVYFVNDVLPIIQSNCAISGCHGGGSAQDGVELSSYENIIQHVNSGNAFDSDIYEAITDSDPDNIMPPPPNSPLTNEQIEIIRNWIDQGATNLECSDCDLTNVTYSQSVWPIIQNSCTGCHSGSSPQGGISLTNYDQVAQLAENGILFGVINHDAGYVPMPFNGQQLSVCKIDTIEEWINQGFPNN